MSGRNGDSKFIPFSGKGQRLDGKPVSPSQPTPPQTPFVPFSGIGHVLGGQTQTLRTKISQRHTFDGITTTKEINLSNVVAMKDIDMASVKNKISLDHQRRSIFGKTSFGELTDQGIKWHYDLKSKVGKGSQEGSQYLHAFPKTGSPNTVDIPSNEVKYVQSYVTSRNKGKSIEFSSDPSKGKAPVHWGNISIPTKQYIYEHERRRMGNTTSRFPGIGRTLGTGLPDPTPYAPPPPQISDPRRTSTVTKPFVPFSGKGRKLKD